ncbi:MAG: hypothetical protein QOK02_6514 [Mycobacterium sp.]|nr:hypothetical protein [Mycobacterium sp.]
MSPNIESNPVTRVVKGLCVAGAAGANARMVANGAAEVDPPAELVPKPDAVSVVALSEDPETVLRDGAGDDLSAVMAPVAVVPGALATGAFVGNPAVAVERAESAADVVDAPATLPELFFGFGVDVPDDDPSVDSTGTIGSPGIEPPDADEVDGAVPVVFPCPVAAVLVSLSVGPPLTEPEPDVGVLLEPGVELPEVVDDPVVAGPDALPPVAVLPADPDAVDDVEEPAEEVDDVPEGEAFEADGELVVSAQASP